MLAFILFVFEYPTSIDSPAICEICALVQNDGTVMDKENLYFGLLNIDWEIIFPWRAKSRDYISFYEK